MNIASMDREDLMQQRNALHLREQFGEKEGTAIAQLQARDGQRRSASWAESVNQQDSTVALSRS
jgi:hypothetical protein